MNEDEVKEYIGEENLESFLRFMVGQTVTIDNDGQIQYYKWDVERFYESTIKEKEEE